jgi:iron transport multicopper oxidase
MYLPFLLFILNVANAIPTTRIYKWTITNFTTNFDGVSRNVLGINNKPGHDNPIDITLGDTLIVSVTNGLNVPTSIHWHGMKQKNTQEMDGAVGASQCGIKPGTTVTYTFVPSESGTYWWHGHFGSQYVDGLKGPFIIRNPNEPHASQYDDEIIIQLTDWYHQQSDLLVSNYLDPNVNPNGNEPVWDTSLLNGKGAFNCNKTKLQCNTNQPVPNFVFVPVKGID